MLRIPLFVFFIVLFFMPAIGQEVAVKKIKNLTPEVVHLKQSKIITDILRQFHYRGTPFQDSLSSVIFDAFFESLDPGRVYFLKGDVASFEEFRFQLDDLLTKGKLKPSYDIFNVFHRRYFNRLNKINNLLNTHQFDFTKDEFYDTDKEENEWALKESELDEKWVKIIKSQVLSLKLTGKSLDESKKMLVDRYGRYQSMIDKYKSEDVFQLYMNVLSRSYDPHTNYFSPANSDNFKIEMSRSLEGIGARLYTDNDYTVVSDIIAGGPAFKSNLIHKDDKIIGITQGDVNEYVDVIGWRIDDVVKLIRGPKGTVVRLTILSSDDGANALPHEIELVREKIKLEDQAVKTEIIPFNVDGQEYSFGLIDIPAFYMDFEEYQKGNKNYSSTSRDVRAALDDLKTKGIDGIIIDLRRNGGGSLSEAIELSGLFIEKGPIVQVRNKNGKVEMGNDPDPTIAYSGPLAVLTSHSSASASEIFAGAIQDYQRGLVVGDQTYGKGTVQNLIDLKRWLPEYGDKTGQLKVTLAKYYRITGNTTQHLGVKPDIRLPSAYDSDEIGESAEVSALPWDMIAPTDFEITGYVTADLIKELNKKYEYRLKTDDRLQDLLKDIAELREDRNNQMVSLNEEVRIKERDEAKKRRDTRLHSTSKEINLEGVELSNAVRLDDDYLHEGLLILADLINSKRQN